MIRLEQYFDSSGSKGWNDLVDLATDHTDIAKVLYARLGEESLDWVYRKVPALDGLSPLAYLETPKLIKRLKEALCRMDI